jgi:hypothetical protein
MAKLASQVICGNHTGNCHSKPIVDPTVNGRVVRGKNGITRKADWPSIHRRLVRLVRPTSSKFSGRAL